VLCPLFGSIAPYDIVMEESPRNVSLAAPLPARGIAAFVDYFVLMVTLSALAKMTSEVDIRFVLTFVVALLYYGLGNSRLTRGQTLGKKLFGLRVVGTNEESPLPIAHSVARFTMLFGVIMLLRDGFSLYFRHQAFVASPIILEFPMLCCLMFFFANIGCVVLAKRHQGFHDLLGKSIVIRERDSSFSGFPYHNRMLGSIGGAMLGFLLWLPAVLQPDPLLRVRQYQYDLEHHLPIRIISITAEQEALSITLELLPHADSVENVVDSTLTRLKNSVSLQSFSLVSFEVMSINNEGQPVTDSLERHL